MISEPRENAKERLEELKAELGCQIAERALQSVQMRESWFDDEWDMGGGHGGKSLERIASDMQRPHFGPRGHAQRTALVQHRSEGRHEPYYYSEWDLWKMLAQSRNLDTFSSIAIGAKDRLADYILGGEWQYEVATRENATETLPQELIDECQRVIDKTMERNDFLCDFDREVIEESTTDGDRLLVAYPNPDGTSRLEMVEPEQIREPADKRSLEEWLGVGESQWNFGVHAVWNEQLNKYDYQRPNGYHIVFDDSGRNFDYIPSWPQPFLPDTDVRCGVHVKKNVPRSSARGVSDYWQIIKDVEGEYRFETNVREGGALQAAIAWIQEQAEGVTASDINTIQIAGQLTSRTVGTEDRSVRYYGPGSVVKTGHGQKYHYGPMGNLKSNVWIEVIQLIMRRIGVRWSMPEYLISGDASSNNFASSLMAEAPFVKAREFDQKFYSAIFRKLFVRVLLIAFYSGRFDRWLSDPRPIIDTLEINIRPKPVATRDQLKHAQKNQIEFDKGILDGPTWAQEVDRDPELVVPPRTFDPFSEPGRDDEFNSDLDDERRSMQGSAQ